jgi:hypothetical protein
MLHACCILHAVTSGMPHGANCVMQGSCFVLYDACCIELGDRHVCVAPPAAFEGKAAKDMLRIINRARSNGRLTTSGRKQCERTHARARAHACTTTHTRERRLPVEGTRSLGYTCPQVPARTLAIRASCGIVRAIWSRTVWITGSLKGPACVGGCARLSVCLLRGGVKAGGAWYEQAGQGFLASTTFSYT